MVSSAGESLHRRGTLAVPVGDLGRGLLIKAKDLKTSRSGTLQAHKAVTDAPSLSLKLGLDATLCLPAQLTSLPGVVTPQARKSVPNRGHPDKV